MRLLNTRTLELQQFVGQRIPNYVILSHTWGDEEVLFGNMRDGTAAGKQGYQKVISACEQARSDEYDWIWIDNVCIDKTSSAELQEAINSMYKWYSDADICYAYLVDVPDPLSGFEGCFATSRWFTRGWTLQELVAPSIVEFYSTDWVRIGTKSEGAWHISIITGIGQRVLEGASPFLENVAERMSWASHRNVTREEDMAYCLLGLFKVSMPMLYGEGRERAFTRLQEELYNLHPDDTIFLWNRSTQKSEFCGLLADSPANFCRVGDCEPCTIFKDELLPKHVSYSMLKTSNGGASHHRSIKVQYHGIYGTFKLLSHRPEIPGCPDNHSINPASHWILLGPWQIGYIYLPMKLVVEPFSFRRLQRPVSMAACHGSSNFESTSIIVENIRAKEYSYYEVEDLIVEVSPNPFIGTEWLQLHEQFDGSIIRPNGQLYFPIWKGAELCWTLALKQRSPVGNFNFRDEALMIKIRFITPTGRSRRICQIAARAFKSEVLKTPIGLIIFPAYSDCATVVISSRHSLRIYARPRPIGQKDLRNPFMKKFPTSKWRLYIDALYDGEVQECGQREWDARDFWPTIPYRHFEFDEDDEMSYGSDNLETPQR